MYVNSKLDYQKRKNDDWVETISLCGKKQIKRSISKKYFWSGIYGVIRLRPKEGGKCLWRRIRSIISSSSYPCPDLWTAWSDARIKICSKWHGIHFWTSKIWFGKNGKKYCLPERHVKLMVFMAFLRGHTNGLYTCDLICHGTPSPMVWNSHVSFISKTEAV